jgi:hypothetical protein
MTEWPLRSEESSIAARMRLSQWKLIRFPRGWAWLAPNSRGKRYRHSRHALPARRRRGLDCVDFRYFEIGFPKSTLGFDFAPTRSVLESANSIGSCWTVAAGMNPARNGVSLLLTSPSSKDENAPPCPPGAGPAKNAVELTLDWLGEDGEAGKTVATFTPCLPQLEHHPARTALHTLTRLTLIQNWHNSRCDTFLSP